MVQYCSAYNCRTIPGDGYSFHTFPKDEKLCFLWCLSMRRRNFVPSMHSRICSKHFTEEDYLSQKRRRCLKPGAIPSVFDFPKDYDSSKRAPMKLQKSTSQADCDTSANLDEDSCNKIDCNKDRPALVIYLK